MSETPFGVIVGNSIIGWNSMEVVQIQKSIFAYLMQASANVTQE